MSLAITLHILFAVIWVGGMFFAYMFLRPVAATLLEPPARLTLWSQVFAKFFPWVWASIVLLLGTGHWMIFTIFGGMGTIGMHVHLMLATGYLMVLLYLYVFFVPYSGLKQAVATQNWPEGGANLNRIRRIVGINTILGLFTIAIGAGGRYLF